MVLVVCPKCGHQWDYKGNSSIYISCPNCLSKIKLSDCLNEILTFSKIKEIYKKWKHEGDKVFEEYKTTKEEFLILFRYYIKIKRKSAKIDPDAKRFLFLAKEMFKRMFPGESYE